ncbi:ABC transporter permease [Ruania sp. N2-46]|uniref:ABC transporter permease n=1 Tax=Occultella gossypii TaxID=2800820 RepID=A0ABS7S4Z1_9MICO|nr:ABC transporter permease [Occultella gossypii]
MVTVSAAEEGNVGASGAAGAAGAEPTRGTGGRSGPAEPSLRRRAGSGAVAAFLRPGLILSVLVLLVVIGWALVPTWFTSVDPLTGVPAEKFTPPGAAHWFGTDETGRDLYARTVHGAGLSLQATVIAVAIAMFVGTTIGMVSGFVGGVVDDVLMRVVDVLLAIPGLLLSLMIVAALGFGTTKVAIAVGVAGIASFARVARGEVLRVRNAPYVEAAFASGVRWPGVLARHVLPNSAGPLVSLATLDFGTAILSVSALSFLGYGEMPPTPEWGVLISDGRNYLASAWWLTTLPGLVIVAVVLAFNRISRALSAWSGGER